MKIYVLSILLLFAASLIIKGQLTDPFVAKCIKNAGENVRHLKDFRIQLGSDSPDSDLRYRVKITLWKNRKYRFTMCTFDNSKGELIISVKDNENKTILSSFDKNIGEASAYIDFNCNKSGIYQLNYDFLNRQSGSGVGVVSMIK